MARRKDATKVVDLMQELSASLKLPAVEAQLAARDKRIAELEGGLREVFSAVDSLNFCAPEMRYVHEKRLTEVRKILGGK